MKDIYIDIETYSGADLKRTGVYRYAEDKEFEIMLFGYSIDENPIEVVDIANGGCIPDDVVAALSDPGVRKWAHNVQFERACLAAHLGTKLDPGGWYDTMIMCRYLGLPASLEKAAAELNLPVQKDTSGQKELLFFSKPWAGKNKVVRHMPADYLDRWENYKSYNKTDVETLIALKKRLERTPFPEYLWEEFWVSERINDRGVPVDVDFAQAAVQCKEEADQRIVREIQNMTEIDNPRSRQQIESWLETKGVVLPDLSGSTIQEQMDGFPEDVRHVLELYLELNAKSSAKYKALLDSVCADGRIRGAFAFYGASETGRFAGRRLQLQNLKRNAGDLDTLREKVLRIDQITADDLGGLVRTVIIPSPGNMLAVADYAQIEARVLAAEAGAAWKLDAFKKGKDIYCEAASKMYNVPVIKGGEGGHLRAQGKIAELACGYGGWIGALRNIGRADQSDDDLREVAKAWREANPEIVNLWKSMENALNCALLDNTASDVGPVHVEKRGKALYLGLPSGRELVYRRARIGAGRKGASFFYRKPDGSEAEMYAGKFVQHATQAIARDLLMHALMNLQDYPVILHVHDEIVVDGAPLEEVISAMEDVPKWAVPGIPVKAEGYTCEYYRKE